MIRMNRHVVATLLAALFLCASATVSLGAPPDRPHARKSLKDAAGGTTVILKPALNGYCPVSYQTEPTPVGGDPNIRVEYRNKLYFFANEEAKQTFVKDPERYAPRLDGLCTTALGGPYGNRFEGDPTVYAVVDNRLYLFSSERAKRSYESRGKPVLERAEALFAKPRLDGVCVVSYQERKAVVPGQADITYPYHHWTYLFAGWPERSDFMKNPEKYLPQYDTFCAEAMSRGLEYPGDPQRFVVYNDKTYLFRDEKAQTLFQTNPKAMIAKADAQWKIIQNRPKPDPGR